MIEFKQSTQIRVPIRLLTSTGLPVPGVTFSGVTVSIEKADGTTSSYVPTNLQWIEVTFGAFNQQGKYDLIITSGFTDQVGPFIVAVGASGANTFIGAFKIITYETQDVFNEAALAASATSLASFQSDFDTWKTDWTTARAGKLDNLSVNVNTLATASALATTNTTVNTINSTVNTINTNVSSILSTVNSSATSITALFKINTNKWSFNTTGVDANKFVIYDNDGSTPLYKFFLYAQDGITNNFITPYFRVPTT